jgi:hypothetical protein
MRAVDAGLLQTLIDNAPRGTDKRDPLHGLFPAWGLAYDTKTAE